MAPPGKKLFPAHRFMLDAAGTPRGLSVEEARKYEPDDLATLERWGYLTRKGTTYRITAAGTEALTS